LWGLALGIAFSSVVNAAETNIPSLLRGRFTKGSGVAGGTGCIKDPVTDLDSAGGGVLVGVWARNNDSQ